MDLSPRKKIILSEIVKAHIANGEPISSKRLCELTNLGLSSATIRNEMSELCDMGYIEQPHTSAGRIPTAMGYRLYVSGLLGSDTISTPMKQAIDHIIMRVSEDPENITALAGQALSDLTGFLSVSMTIPGDSAFIRRVELLPMGRRTVMLLLITSDGIARSRICRTGENISGEMVNAFDMLISTDVVGHKLSEFTNAFVQTVAAKSGQYGISLLPVFSALFEMIENVCRLELDVKGESNIYSFYSKEKDARRIVDYISHGDGIRSILSNISDPISVVFGDDIGIEALKPSSIVVAKFGGENRIGRIGVIGPTRMSYEDIIPSIGYFAKQLSKAIEQSISDLDD